jgi:hypothetical protein
MSAPAKALQRQGKGKEYGSDLPNKSEKITNFAM